MLKCKFSCLRNAVPVSSFAQGMQLLLTRISPLASRVNPKYKGPTIILKKKKSKAITNESKSDCDLIR